MNVAPRMRPTAVHDYPDADGTLLYQALRFDLADGGKRFAVRRPNGGGEWIWDLADCRRVVYRLPELLEDIGQDRPVVVVEGEKCADFLRARGVPATTNPLGAGKWRDEYNAAFKAANVVVIGDNDTAGRKHVAMVAAALAPVVAKLRMLDLAAVWPDIREHDDVVDWFERGGGTVEALWRIVDSLPDCKADAAFNVDDDDRATKATDTVPQNERSEDLCALIFEHLHGADLKFVAPWGQWLAWTGQHWRREQTLRAFHLCRLVVRERAVAAKKPAFVSARTVAGVEKLARAAPAIAATVDAWDRNAFLLNTPAGTIELGNGSHRLRPHQREDFCAKITAVGPSGEGCPLFLDFLRKVTGGDDALIAFLQRLAGYCLTGSTKEQILAFFHGTGANGKSTFLDTLRGILGDYGRHAASEVFTATRFEHHSTELAALHGARLVTAIETERGRQWAESRIKALTGGDPIRARFMRMDSFEYVPACKIVVAANVKPRFIGVDEAIRRRILLVPWTVRILDSERDKNLRDKLRTEWGGILAWALVGYDEWSTKGLAPPAVVTDATADYLEAEDVIGLWLDDACDRRNPDAFTATSSLYSAWRKWAEDRGEPVGTMRAFTEELRNRGLTPYRTPAARGFKGVELKADPTARRWDNDADDAF